MIKPTNNRILVSLTKEDYRRFTTEPNIPVFRGTVHSISEGSFSENPVATDGNGNFSWVRRPSNTGLEPGDPILFVRDGMCQPAVIKDDGLVDETIKGEDLPENLLYLVLIEEQHIFAAIMSDASSSG